MNEMILREASGMEIRERLWKYQDDEYGDFQCRLTPGLKREAFIGVRVPDVRKLAKEYKESKEAEDFLSELPHEYYDENMLHSILLSQIREYDHCMEKVKAFLPYIDNWAVCDTLSPKVFGRHKEQLLEEIRMWIRSGETYTCRFGIGMLMRHFLDEDFKAEYLQLVSSVVSEEYYVKMMAAWYFATALSKQWKDTIYVLEENILSPWVHNKTIQKAIESYRITEEEKKYLRTLRRKAES